MYSIKYEAVCRIFCQFDQNAHVFRVNIFLTFEANRRRVPLRAIKTWNGDEGLIYLRKGVRIKFRLPVKRNKFSASSIKEKFSLFFPSTQTHPRVPLFPYFFTFLVPETWCRSVNISANTASRQASASAPGAIIHSAASERHSPHSLKAPLLFHSPASFCADFGPK
jgi:hypothetical protein